MVRMLRSNLVIKFSCEKLVQRKFLSIFKVSLGISLEGISSLTRTITPPSNSLRFLRKDVVKPGILNCPSGNDSSSLVSDMTKMATYPLI